MGSTECSEDDLSPRPICTWKPDAWIAMGDGVAVLAKLSYAERGRSPSMPSDLELA